APAPDGLTEDLASLVGGTADSSGAGSAAQVNGPRSDAAYISGGLGSQPGAVPLGGGGIHPPFLSGLTPESGAVDKLCAAWGENSLTDALGTNVTSASVD